MMCPLCAGGAIHCDRAWYLKEAARLRDQANEYERAARKCALPEDEKMGREHRLQWGQS
jgi:hypothetical protein